MFGTRQRHGERDARRRQEATGLSGLDPAGRGGPPVEHPLHRVLHVVTRLTAPQELQMHGGGQLRRFDGAGSGGEGLGHELPPERTLALRSAGRPDPAVLRRARHDVEQAQQCTHATVPASVSR